MRRALAWALGAVLVVLGVRLVALSVVDRSPGATRDRAVETLRHLSSDLEAQADAMQRLFPEGRLFTAALTGIAWSNVGLEAEGHAEPALEGCARTVDPSARAVARAWVSRAVLEADPATGLIPHAARRPDPRGSSSALMVPFLAEVDPSVGRDQFSCAPGLPHVTARGCPGHA